MSININGGSRLAIKHRIIDRDESNKYYVETPLDSINDWSRKISAGGTDRLDRKLLGLPNG